MPGRKRRLLSLTTPLLLGPFTLAGAERGSAFSGVRIQENRRSDDLQFRSYGLASAFFISSEMILIASLGIWNCPYTVR